MNALTLNRRIGLLLLVLAYGTIVFIGVLHHEPWRDEAHFWNSAKEDSIGQIIDSAHYAPTPVMWTLLLVPFAKTGFPYMSMNILSSSIAIVAVGLLLFLSPIPIGIKILISFSYFFAYEYAVIARPYIFTVFSLFAIASMYRDRLDKPILYGLCICLLLQTNFYSSVPAGIFYIYYIFEVFKHKAQPKHIVAILLMSSVALFTFISYIPHAHGMSLIPPGNIAQELARISENAISSTIYFKIIHSEISPLNTVVSISTIIVFVAFFFTLFKTGNILFIACLSLLWLFVANLFLHGGTIRHHGLFFVYMIFFIWISSSSQRSRFQLFVKGILYMFLSFLLLVSIASTVYIYGMDYQYSFSGARDMAEYITKHHLEKRNVVLYRAAYAESLLPYFNTKTFWYPQLHAMGRYHMNDSRSVDLIRPWEADVILNASDQFPNDSSVLYILSQPVGDLPNAHFTLLHESLAPWFWGNETEQFWLYTRDL
jgi:hypothetical protein